MLAASLLAEPDACAQPPMPAPQVGEQHEIIRSYENSEHDSEGSTGSSRGTDAILERIVASTESGIEVEYDLWLGATAEDRARQWFFPARVLRQPDGAMRLLNRAELEARLERWLATAEWTRAICGRWIFTWNGFLIECNPEAVIETIAAFDLRSVDLREGALYRDSDARGPGMLRRIMDESEGTRFVAAMDVDPDAVRRERAEMDVALGEIMQTPVTLESALRARATERVSGRIEVTIDTYPDGTPRRRTRVTRLEIIEVDGRRKNETRTVTVERRPVSGATGRQ